MPLGPAGNGYRRLLLSRAQWLCFLSLVRKDYIEAQASALRPGHDCILNLPDTSAIDGLSVEEAGAFVGEKGGMRFYNHHYILTFDDGVKWIVRCRRLRKDRPSEDVVRMVLDSEIQTMDSLREAGVAVPKACRPPDIPGHPSRHSYDLYFFTDCVEAREFPLAFLQQQTKPLQKLLDDGRLTNSFISTFIASYAEEMVKLASKGFSAIGSLYSEDGKAFVGPLIDKFVGSHTKPYFCGPFKTAYERVINIINFNLDMILHHDGYPGDPTLNYLLLMDLREIVEGWKELKQVNEAFYVQHRDSKADQCFTDDEGNIVAWIDWEWAIVTTKAEAFGAPQAFHGWGISDALTEWEQQLVDAYLELGRPDLADCVRGGRKYHWLEKLANPSSGTLCPPQDYHAYRQYMQGSPLKKRARGRVLESWIEQLRVVYGEDPGYQTLVKRREGGAKGIGA